MDHRTSPDDNAPRSGEKSAIAGLRKANPGDPPDIPAATVREPVVDVLEEGNQVRVIAELPGVSEGDITYEVAGDVLTISTKGDRRYHAEVLLPRPAEIEGMESSYNSGILELKLRNSN